jgi:hypothetical protein
VLPNRTELVNFSSNVVYVLKVYILNSQCNEKIIVLSL